MNSQNSSALSQSLSNPKQPKSIKKKRKGKKVAKMISSTYKKKKCEFYNRGSCGKGAQCTFSHNFIPDAAKRICKFYLSGSCSKGEDCPYSHNTKRYPCKFYHIQQNCRDSENCRFSHGEIEQSFISQFLKDNEELLIKIIKEGRSINPIFSQYVDEQHLMKKQKEEMRDNSLIEGLIGGGELPSSGKQSSIHIQQSTECKRQIKMRNLEEMNGEQKVTRYYVSLQCFLHSYY